MTMKRVEFGRVIGTSLAVVAGAFALSGCAHNSSPKTEKVLQTTIQQALRQVGSRAITLAAQNPDTCFTTSTGKQTVEISCLSTKNIDGSDNFGNIDAFMNTINGKPDPNSTIYVDVGFNNKTPSLTTAG